MLSVGVHGIFSLNPPPPLSHTSISFTTSTISFTSIVPHIFHPGGFTCNFSLCLHVHRPDVMDVTDQDCLAILSDTRRVGNLAYYPIPRLTITFCRSTFFIPTEIKFSVICEKIDVVNKVLPYVIKFVACIAIVLSFLCCCVVVSYVFTLFILGQC